MPATPPTPADSRRVPADALRFAGEARFDLGQFAGGESGSTAPGPTPAHLVLRSGEPIAHWYWGQCVHDMAGMQSFKNTYPLDYVHDPSELIGHFTNLDTSHGQLEADATIIPTRPDDRASEILHRAKAGTPYEASLAFDPRTVKIQQLDQGEVAQVNGRQVEGPMAIFRQWDIRGGALCPQGADKFAHAEFSDGGNPGEFSVHVYKEPSMAPASPQEKPAEAGVLSTPASPQEKPAEAAAPSQSAEATPAQAAAVGALAAATPPDRQADGKRFLDAFGDRGGKWFAEGLSFEDAGVKYAGELKARVEQLEKRLGGAALAGATAAAGGLSFGETEPLSSEPANADPAAAAKLTDAQLRYGKGFGAFAASIQLPGKK